MRIVKINNKIKKSAVLTIATASILITALTMAYFVSSDAVTNRLNAQHPSVELLEPKWYSDGMNLANASEPGMLIDKNPYARNNGKIDIYVRIKMKISVSQSQNKNLSENAENPEIRKLSALEVRNRILKSLVLNDKKTLLVNSIDENGNIIINHSLFQCDITPFCDYAVEKAEDDDFTYYFYFVKQSLNSIDNSELIVLHPDECSAELFNYVDIPIYKKDYLGVFDQNYEITLIAEAVPTASCETNTVAEYKRVVTS